MKRRDIVIGIAVLGVIGSVLLWRQRTQKEEAIQIPEPQTLSVETTLEDKFNTQIPDDVEKAELKDVVGGTGSAVATRKFENNTFTHSVLADLPDPESGKFYQAWLVKGNLGEEGYAQVSTGRVVMGKGGWKVDYKSQADLSENNKVVISLETRDDNTIETKVLEGSF